MVADAKYKDYGNKKIGIGDIRQICGYARLKKVYDALKIDPSQNIGCLIIYPNQKLGNKFDNKEQLIKLEDEDFISFYKAGISLPKIGQSP
jgi:5-methylcytosine-specific restriction enzyme subunit McrC